MTKTALLAALMTGVFCAGFTVAVDALTEVLSLTHALALSALSGFLGSLLAHFLLRKGAAND